MSEVEINGHTYRIGKIDAMRQWHMVRRIAPALIGVLGMANLRAAAKDEEMDVRELIDRIEPFLEALSKMSDEDNDYVIDTCLSVVERNVGNDRGWIKIGTSGQLQYDDIDLLVILRLTFEAGRENLLGFFAALRRMYPSLLETEEPVLQ